MRSSSRLAWNNLSRLALLAVLLLPTIQIAIARHEWFASTKLMLWGLALALLPVELPALPYAVFVGLMWLLSPLMLVYMSYVTFNGGAPPSIAVAAMLFEASDENIFLSLRTILSSTVVCEWFSAYLFLLAFATIGIWAGRRALRRAAKPALAFCVLALSLAFWWQIIFFGVKLPPAWMMDERDLQQTFLGEMLDMAYNFFDPDFHDRVFGSGAAHQLAHDEQIISKPMLSVLVIGESMRASGLEPEKASRGPWTARLAERAKADLAAWLPPACASHDSTAISVPMLLTGLPPAEKDEAAAAPTGLARLEAAGYRVGWITSSSQVGFAGPEVMKGRGFFYSEDFYDNPFDGDLLPVADNFLAPLMKEGYDGKPMGLVLHIVGSHYDYKGRYPPTLFGPEPKGLSDEELDYLRYERANEYTAKFLAELGYILDKVKVPAFAVYTSDHGENLLRDHNGLLRHVGPRTSSTAIKVPVFVLWNEAARKTGAPERVLAKLRKAPVIAQVDIYHAWMSLAGLDDGKAVEPTSDPQVYGAVNIGDTFEPLSCSRLLP